jgi:hypothetical protein
MRLRIDFLKLKQDFFETRNRKKEKREKRKEMRFYFLLPRIHELKKINLYWLEYLLFSCCNLFNECQSELVEDFL